MRLKLHQLTNLQDARAGAAWGAHYLGFSLERGSPYKLSEQAVQEFFEWLAGSFLVIQLGKDLDQLDALSPWLREHRLYVELDAAEAARRFESDTLRVPVPFGLSCDAHRIRQLPAELLAQAQYLEAVRTHQSELNDDYDRLKSYLPAGLPLLLFADFMRPEQLATLKPHFDGFSMGQHLPDAFGQLDYDAVEDLLEQMGELA